MCFFHFVKETNFEKKNLTGNETRFEKERVKHILKKKPILNMKHFEKEKHF